MITQFRRFSFSTIALGMAACLAYTASLADGGDESPRGDASRWGLGVMGVAGPEPYRGVDNKAEVWPVVTYENRWVRFMGPQVDFKLGNTGPVSYALTASYSRNGYQSDDSAYLAGMEDRKDGFWLGGKINWKTPVVSLTTAWKTDVSNNSKGQQVSLAAERRFRFDSLGVTPSLGVKWQDDDYVNYYYGVKRSEARANRAAYSGTSTFSPEIGIRFDYQVAPKHMIMLDTGVTFLGSSIKDSPLVDRSSVYQVRAGYMYLF